MYGGEGGTSVTTMLSMGGWTKTSVGGLTTPSAVAVTCTAPEAAGLQMVNVASNRPAQACPPAAKLRMLVSLDWKVKATLMLALELFTALAENLSVLPSCSDVLPPGFSVTLAGMADLDTTVCPPQPPRTSKHPTATPLARRLARELPMHPFSSPRAGRAARMELRNLQ